MKLRNDDDDDDEINLLEKRKWLKEKCESFRFIFNAYVFSFSFSPVLLNINLTNSFFSFIFTYIHSFEIFIKKFIQQRENK